MFEGVSDEDGCRRLLPMNCLSWIMAHLALQEQRYWIHFAQGPEAVRHPELVQLSGYPDTATTPELSAVRPIWEEVVVTADRYLETLDQATLLEHFVLDGEQAPESIGTLMLRNIYHYWFHTGEAHAIRQQFGHDELPVYVGNLSAAPYR